MESVAQDYSPVIPDAEEVGRLQAEDSDFVTMRNYLQHGELPLDEKSSQKIVLESKYFTVVNGVLYREDRDRPCIAVPLSLRQQLMEEAHKGRFAGHLADKKVHDRLRRTLWWPSMRNDVNKFCYSCLQCSTCSTRKTGRRCFKPPLHPIPVYIRYLLAVHFIELPSIYYSYLSQLMVTSTWLYLWIISRK